MSDPSQPRQPTQEELEAHLAQLRQADVAEVVVQAVNMLATGAQVKLGRTDARPLIDALGAIADACDGRVDDDVVRQIRDAVGQLQMAQVQAEREGAGEEAAAGGQQGAAPGPQAGGGPAPPRTGAGQPPRTGAGQPPRTGAGEQEGAGRMTDRLWIPGREPDAR